MESQSYPHDTVLVLFGATGDLAHRKIVSALFNLFLDNQLPAGFSLVGVDRRNFSDKDLQNSYYDSIRKNVSRSIDDEAWQRFAGNFWFLQGDYDDENT